MKDFDNDSYDEIVEVIVETKKSEVDLVNIQAKDLLIYFANRFKEVHGYEYVVSWVKEVGVFKAYILRYDRDAGPMVALLFDKYQGSLNGSVMTVTAFARGSKWIQDRLYIELKQETSRVPVKAEGLMNGAEFVERLRMGSRLQESG